MKRKTKQNKTTGRHERNEGKKEREREGERRARAPTQPRILHLIDIALRLQLPGFHVIETWQVKILFPTFMLQFRRKHRQLVYWILFIFVSFRAIDSFFSLYSFFWTDFCFDWLVDRVDSNWFKSIQSIQSIQAASEVLADLLEMRRRCPASVPPLTRLKVNEMYVGNSWLIKRLNEAGRWSESSEFGTADKVDTVLCGNGRSILIEARLLTCANNSAYLFIYLDEKLLSENNQDDDSRLRMRSLKKRASRWREANTRYSVSWWTGRPIWITLKGGKNAEDNSFVSRLFPKQK